MLVFFYDENEYDELMDSIKIVSYIIAAAIPALAIYLVFLLDLFGTGKFSTVLAALIWGALFAFNLSRFVNNQALGSIGYENVTRFSAPVIEEVFKSAILLYFVTRPRFRYIVDGAVYGFAVGIGFAVMENFYYIKDLQANAALTVAISRVLSASLMHATASALVGIMLGRLRRSQLPGPAKYVWPLVGILGAIIIHMFYNNVVQIESLGASLLLLLGIGIGLGGSVVIAYSINKGLEEEKRHFAETLGLDVGVTRAERKVVQELGSNVIEDMLTELGDYIGKEKVEPVRQLLVIQANIGILSNNLRAPASQRMKEAWQKEIADLRSESDKVRKKLGLYAMSLLRNVFPVNDVEMWEVLSGQIADYDPSHVYKFDLFINMSQVVHTFTAEQLEIWGERLKKMEIFSLVDIVELDSLSRAIVERSFSDGEIIFRQGDEGDAMYMIESGGINIYVDDKFIRTYKPGNVVGDFALFDGQPRSATAKANGDLQVIILRRNHVNMFVNTRPHVIKAILGFLAERLRYTTGIIEDAVGRTVAIAQGDYGKLFQWEPAPAPMTTAALAAAANNPMHTTMDLRNIVGGGTQQLGGAFAKLAVALERREKALEDKVKKAKTSP